MWTKILKTKFDKNCNMEKLFCPICDHNRILFVIEKFIAYRSSPESRNKNAEMIKYHSAKIQEDVLYPMSLAETLDQGEVSLG